ncbi:MAG TPA: hypothetical protein VJ741_04615, partial [Solirubrobacteraceae bacterium]|nr:hypothetical protein [Solirubrobacteraceae bacterium]
AGNDTENGGAGNDYMGWTYVGNTVPTSPPPEDMTDPGADTYTGGGGDDEVTYVNASGGVNVSLDGVANDGQPSEQDNVEPDIDHVFGTALDDTLTAGTGSVTLDGQDGNDTLYGGPGRDTLEGGPGDDTINTAGPDGAGPASVYGDYGGCSAIYSCPTGNDTINADDGVAQQIGCGPGGDIVHADALDTVATDPVNGCETVSRSTKGSSPGTGTGTGPGAGTGTGTSGGQPPVIRSARAAHRSTSSRRGITVRITLAGAGKLNVLIARRTVKGKRGHGHHTRVVWVVVGNQRVNAPGGSSQFTVRTLRHHRLAPGVYRLTLVTVLGKARSRAITLTVTVTR